MLIIESIILCAVFFLLCFLGTGTDEKNLKNYMSYPDVVQDRIQTIKEYRGRFRETNKLSTWFANLVVFTLLFFLLGMIIRKKEFRHNFLALLLLGQALNVFDLLVIDLLWWRNTKKDKALENTPKGSLPRSDKASCRFSKSLTLVCFCRPA
ncbi:MAG: ABC transporter permease [Eubacteriales bacterium]|nr:ABC transporter permease [Clostridiales bacterium]MDY5836730.1 ABC transporter permease [Eubacteriales bacterium]